MGTAFMGKGEVFYGAQVKKAHNIYFKTPLWAMISVCECMTPSHTAQCNLRTPWIGVLHPERQEPSKGGPKNSQ